MLSKYKFQSTQPEWAATNEFLGEDDIAIFISIHAARVGCDWHESGESIMAKTISIHAARVGCDVKSFKGYGLPKISIHAARVGCDETGRYQSKALRNFNPRSPSGLRQQADTVTINRKLFQSTQPEWAATGFSKPALFVQLNFNPRSPSGLRLCARWPFAPTHLIFQSTQPEWAAT